MTHNIYDDLQKKFNSLPIGYPRTESGVEMEILRSLYDEEEAAMALNLSILPRTPREIAESSGRDASQTANFLKKMSDKGLAFRRRKGDELSYCLVPFLPGIWEFQIRKLTPEFNERVDRYYNSGLGQEVFGSQTAYFKVVPNDKNISAELAVFPYEQVSNIVKNAQKVAVFDCICRIEKKMQGEGCDKPIDVCMAFGPNADYYIELGIAKEVTKEEAIHVLDRAEEAGLVHCSMNTMAGHFAICNCCSCCCAILRGVTRLNLPTAVAKSNFYAKNDPALCTGCQICTERCQVNAIVMEDDVALVLTEKCIGCGLCISTCPTESMQMLRKLEDEIKEPPARVVDLIGAIAREKGRALA